MNGAPSDAPPQGLPKIAIVGANGQVGAELCLFLKSMGELEPVAIARSRVGTALLRRLGIECRHGDFRSPEEGRRLLEGCDAVLDLALPFGASPSETRAIIARRLDVMFASLDRIPVYIFASTMAVYRLDPDEPRYKWYGATKLYAERVAARLARRGAKQLYVLRLGQVHGVMQSCSHELADGLHDGMVVQLPDIPSFSVFVYSIAEAAMNIVAGKEKPGTYTLVSTPAWSWDEVLRWFARNKGVDCEIRTVHQPAASAVRRLRSALVARIKGALSRSVNRHKELISAVLSAISPELEARLRFRHALGRARLDVASLNRGRVWEPVRQARAIPGARLRSLGDSRQQMALHWIRVGQWIEALLAK